MDPMNRKRPSTRQPLRETSGNIRSPLKRFKGISGKSSGNNGAINAANGDGADLNQIPELSAPLQLNSSKTPSLKPTDHQENEFQQHQQHQHHPQPLQRRPSNQLQMPAQITTRRSEASKPMISKADAAKPRLSRLVGDELQEWRNNWRKIMKSSVVYFDTQGIDLSNPTHQLEQKRAQRGLKHIGSTLVPFYDKDVTIIVSKRPYNPTYNYLANDIFHDVTPLKIKVWNFDKVFRFLKNLGVHDFDNLSNNQTETAGDLSNLLREEKIFGSADKDPNARREDLHYLDKNYLYVYDLSQNVRPIAVREWNDESYPSFHLTLDGKCPFLPESDNLERKRLKRLKKFEETEGYRHLLKKVADDLINSIKNRRTSMISLSSDQQNNASTDNDSTISQGSNRSNGNSNDSYNNDDNEHEHEHEHDSEHDNNNNTEQTRESNNNKNKIVDDIGDGDDGEEEEDDEINFELNFKHPKPSLTRNSSGIPTNNSNSRYYDVAASGFHGTSNAVQLSVDSGNFIGNGLGPTISQVPSKNINNLKRRIFMKKQKQISFDDKEKNKDLKPGYCENCRVKYDHFDDHINSNRHRRFALDDSNFADIDNLIETINENKALGLVTSDGDYSYSKN